MIIPRYIVSSQEEFDAIKDPYCYLVGSEGVFIKKETFAYKVIQPTFDKNTLKAKDLFDIEPGAFLKIRRMKYKELKPVLDFFIWSANELESEAAVYIYYSPVRDKYLFIPPKQEVGPASISYERTPASPAGYKTLGTIHSHVDMSAFHSGTDVKDQESFDGIHITIGKVRGNPEYEIKLFVGGVSYKVDNFIEDKPQRKLVFPANWKEVISKPKPKPTTYFGWRRGYNTNKDDKIKEFVRATISKRNEANRVYDSTSYMYITYKPKAQGGYVSVGPLSGTIANDARILIAEWDKLNFKEKVDWIDDQIDSLKYDYAYYY